LMTCSVADVDSLRNTDEHRKTQINTEKCRGRLKTYHALRHGTQGREYTEKAQRPRRMRKTEHPSNGTRGTEIAHFATGSGPGETPKAPIWRLGWDGGAGLVGCTAGDLAIMCRR
jgi:hypothetical protein